jgi:hypothetical protein
MSVHDCVDHQFFCGIYLKAILCVTESVLYELLVHLDVFIKVTVCHPLVV